MRSTCWRRSRQFRPEFLNRVDEIVVFHGVDREHLAQIVDIQLERLRRRLAERRITLEVLRQPAPGLHWRASATTRSTARDRSSALIQREVETPVARLIVAGKLRDGGTVRVDVAGDELRVEAQP